MSAADDVQRLAVLGAGTIGASWTALFLAAGLEVAVHDPAACIEGWGARGTVKSHASVVS